MRIYLLTLLAFCSIACAQTALDPTQSGAYPAFPTFADKSCGHVTLSVEQYDGAVAMVRAVTTCPGSGRGSKARTWLYCTAVATPDGYTIVVGERQLVTSWVFGSAPMACPVAENNHGA